MINTKQQWSWLYPRHQPGVDDKPLPSHVLAGLTTAGVASTLLTTLFAHIIGTITATTTTRPSRRFWTAEEAEDFDDETYYTFPSYDSGGRVALLTLASLGGAWWFDQQTNHVTQNHCQRRSDWIGAAGVVLTVAWVQSLLRRPWLYEACFGIFTILLASTATERAMHPKRVLPLGVISFAPALRRPLPYSDD